MQSQTCIVYGAPEGITYVDDSRKFGHTVAGKFYARAELAIFSESSSTWVTFDHYVQLTKADLSALREGTAEFVIGRIEEPLPRDTVGQYYQFHPEGSSSAANAVTASYILDGLDPIFNALAAQEAA